MLPGSKKQSNRGIVIGLLLLAAGRAIANPDMGSPMIGDAISLGSLIVFAWGCSAYARGKGYHPAFGLFGLFSLAGLLVLFLLRDRFKCCDKGGETCTHGRIETRSDRYSRAA